jgi:hypothetical protein
MAKMVMGTQKIGGPGSVSCDGKQRSSECCGQRRATDAFGNESRNRKSRVRRDACLVKADKEGAVEGARPALTSTMAAAAATEKTKKRKQRRRIEG